MKRMIIWVAVLMLGVGCTRRELPPSDMPDSETVFVRVTNEGTSLVRVYVNAESVEQWIGTVAGEQRGTFTVPPVLVHGASKVSFTAESPVTGQRFRTPIFVIRPGSYVYLDLGSRLNSSTWRVE